MVKRSILQCLVLTVQYSGEIRGTIDIGINKNIVHRDVNIKIAVDRGVLMSVTPDVIGSKIHQLSTNPTIYGLIESRGKLPINTEPYQRISKIESYRDEAINSAIYS